MKELSLVIFKPDVFEADGLKNRVEERFYEEITRAGLSVIEKGEKIQFTPKLCEEHYGHVKKYNNGQWIFDITQEFMLSGKSQPLIIAGENAIMTVRKIIGPTIYAKEGLRATSESSTQNSARNYVHASGLAKEGDPYREAKEEIARFFPKSVKKLQSNPDFAGFWGK